MRYALALLKPPVVAVIGVIATIVFPTAESAGAGPADQYVMYVTTGTYSVVNSNPVPPISPFFGSIEAADFYVNEDFHAAGFLIDRGYEWEWDFVTPVFKAVMSALGESAVNRLDLQAGKPILNTRGEVWLASAADLFSDIPHETPLYTEFEVLPTPNATAWTGTNASGLHSTSCESWSVPSASGRFGLINAPDSRWINNGVRQCNQAGSFYALGLLESPRAPGDYNDDGQVDGGDFLAWQQQLGSQGVLRPADGNGNGTVDTADLAEWKTPFLSDLTVQSSDRTTVPEPASN